MPEIGVVVADFYVEIAEGMERRAREYADSRGATIAEVITVPGVYDTPLPVDKLARRDTIDAVVVLGAIIEGDTNHDRVVAHAAARKLADVSLERDVPVTFGVVGPGMSRAAADERIEYGANAMNSALDILDALPGDAN
ncbi:6,7-dimethyl-8-ribityllumazine synthase [Haladaptatus sp. NG-SE-30]